MALGPRAKQLNPEGNAAGKVTKIQSTGIFGISYEQDPTAERKIANTTGVDLKTVATTTLYTVPSGKVAIITKVIIRITTGTSITADAVAGVGIAANEDDIFTSETLLNVRSTNDIWVFDLTGKSRTAPSTAVVKLGVDTGAVGTTLTADIDTYGYLTDDPISS